jgi:nucleoside-diphosphate-sugar epimerase
MRVFVTGASGFIGSALVPELIGAGHQVVGFARSDASAAAIAAAGAEVQRGSLDDLGSLQKGAEGSDGVIHLAFIHDFTQYDNAVRADELAIDAIGAVLEGSGRPFVIASGTAALAPGRVGTERDPLSPNWPRGAAADAALALAERNVRSSVVRLPPTVHGEGDHGFMATLVDVARTTGISGYMGDGANRWPAVHQRDAARLFRLALEQAPAGSVWHAVADQGVPIRTVAEAIASHLDIPAVSMGADDAGAQFGWLGFFLAIDAPASSEITRELLNWRPRHVGLIDDLNAGHYFLDRPITALSASILEPADRS